MLMYAFITAKEEEEKQQQEQLQPQPQRVRRTVMRPVWVQPWISEERIQNLGQFSSLLNTHLRLEDPVTFQKYTRLTPQLFDEVLERVVPAIEKQVTRFRQPLSPRLKLAVTLWLRHLATGDSYRPLEYAFRCGVSSISKMVPQVCRTSVNCPSVQRWGTQPSSNSWSLDSHSWPVW